MKKINSKYLIIISVCLFFGIVVGLIYPNIIEKSGFLLEYIIEKSNNKAMFNIFFEYFNYLFLIFLLGFLPNNLYFCSIAIFIRGFLFGIFFSVSLKSFGIGSFEVYSSIKYCIVNFFIKYFTILPLYVFLTYISVIFSCDKRKGIFGKNCRGNGKDGILKEYILFFLFGTGICFFNALGIYYLF